VIDWGEIQNGNWDPAADCMSSVNQGFCWDTGDMLGWGKAPGRDETSALSTSISWEASLCHNLLKEQPVLYTKAFPMGLSSQWCTGWQISDHWDHSSAPPGPHYPKHPPLIPPWSPLNLTPKACEACDPEIFTISAPTGPVPLKSAQACVISALLGCVPKAF
jgi:hypothetical protein